MSVKEEHSSEGQGLTGLANIGNTCYLSSILQVLSHTPPLAKILTMKEYDARLTKTPGAILLNEWKKLYNLMWSEDCTIAPWGFVNACRKVAALKSRTEFAGMMQADAPDFLGFVIECFHEGLARKVKMEVSGGKGTARDLLAAKCYDAMKRMYESEYSEMINVFYGISVSRVCSLEGKVLGVSPEPFNMLQFQILPGSNLCTLEDCVADYCKKERLEGENAYRLSETGTLVSADRDFTFWSLPSVLIIHLKRFSNSISKLSRNVQIPIDELDMSPYVSGYKRWQYKYELFGACNHSGGVHGGHYHCHVLTPAGWHNFNDARVTRLETPPKLESAYCLFYRKKK